MTGYNLINLGALGVGTSTPAFPLDVENGYINTNLGYLVAGGAGTMDSAWCRMEATSGLDPAGARPRCTTSTCNRVRRFQPQEPYINFAAPLAAADNSRLVAHRCRPAELRGHGWVIQQRKYHGGWLWAGDGGDQLGRRSQ